MVQVTNISPGVRILHVKGDGGKALPFALQPKQSEDLDLFDPKSKIIKGLVALGDIVVGKRPDEKDEGDGTDILKALEARLADETKRAADLQRTVDDQQKQIDSLKDELAKAKAPAAPAPSGSQGGGSYVLKDKGGGWFVVTKNTVELTKALRNSEVEGFDKFSDADKVAFVDRNKPA